MHSQEECDELYPRETKQPLHRQIAQHRRAASSGQDSAGHLHLKDSGKTPLKTASSLERGAKEAIQVKLKKSSLNRGGGLRHFLSPTYNAALHSLGENAIV